MSKGQEWTDQETLILQENFGKIKVSEMIEKGLLKRTQEAIWGRAKKLKLKSGIRSRKYYVDLDFWKVPNLISAYWGGFNCADGTIVKDPLRDNTHTLTLRLAVKDENHLRQFKEDIKYDGEIKHIICKASSLVKKERVQCFFNVCQAGHWVEDLKQFGIIQNKTLRIPPPILQNNILKLAFMKGYIDGDGSLSIKPRGHSSVHIISSCLAIMEWFKNLSDELFPIRYNTNKPWTKINPRFVDGFATCYTYQLNGLRALRFIDTIKKIPTRGLERKWNKPRMDELITESKIRFPKFWAIPLPIDKEIDEFLVGYNSSTILYNSRPFPCNSL